ncbi:hypothetical protein [Candidatus Laterigemmans baculatus]|uniref:hypothetical protein n=1 Tax=Candidatus Laterigemmans baculatus TaxID=2770505 RepID=UPI0013D90EB8|nr:hypothetical protein [Candidatus Laterigemmans baculatus]
MRLPQLRHAVFLLLACVAANPKPAAAQDAGTIIRFTVHPAGDPTPALKHRLMPPLLEQRPGNAAVWYGKVAAEQQAFFVDREMWKAIEQADEWPLEEVLANEQIQKATRDSPIFFHLENAARSDHVDWQLPFRDQPYYTMLLPETQQTRQFSRLLAVRVRRQVAKRDFEGAIRSLQSGYALARFVAEGHTMVNGLVGIDESNAMSRQVREFVQHPESPNLYWALTALPDPLINARPGIEAELAALELSFPFLQDLTRSEYGEEYWRGQLEEVWKLARNFTDQSDDQLAFLGDVVRGYPIAKQGLIDAGWESDRVEKLAVSQAILAYSMLQYEARRDGLLKWLFVPYPASHPQPSVENVFAEADSEEILPLSGAFLPAFQGYRYAMARAQREIAVLRMVEAIRLYGSRHEGRIPPSLDAFEVPIPLDPMTGKPFEYRVDQQTAIIEGPPSHPSGSDSLHAEVRFATATP